VGSAATAWADEGGKPLKDEIRSEIKAYMKAEKEKKDAEDKEKGTVKVKWDGSLKFEDAAKTFKAKLTGRIQLDYWAFDAEEQLEAAVGQFDTGVFFRRARMGIELEICKRGWAKFEYEFARGGSNQSFADAFIGLRHVDECWCGFPDVRAGHFFEPLGFESATSSRCTTFIERATLDALVPARNTGIEFSNDPIKERLFYQVGAFHAFTNGFGDGIFNEDPTVNDFEGDDDGWAVTGRVAGRPWVDCMCPEQKWLHVGASASYRDDLREVRFRSRPEVGIGPRVVDTGAFAAESMTEFGVEAAFLWNRLHVAGEALWVNVDSAASGDPSYMAWYVEAGYYLTGEHRGYNTQFGRFDCTKVCRPFLCPDCCGGGAWQVALRWSTLDLDDPGRPGGTVSDITAAVNWWVNNNMRLQFNYVFADVENANNTGVDGNVNAFGVRLQVFW
jgi:phosphate-selective porin OprO/OprP